MKNLSLYIHIPFCKSRCLYCNFLTFADKGDWIPDYIESLCKEIAGRSRNFEDYRVETIYFGGGTPSLIDPLLIKKIIQQIKACFKVKHGAEISIECNPESVDLAKLRIYKNAGVNRFSLGIQSFNDKTLRRIGRIADSKAIFKALGCFKKARIKNFGADFIMGLPQCGLPILKKGGMPGQTLTSFKLDVTTILKFIPAHLSFYFLSHDTPKINIFIKECPNEDAQIRMYEWLCKRLKKAGFIHYEVSNWARLGRECEHNKRYWNQQNFLGIGLGAQSCINDVLLENQRDFVKYLRNPTKIENRMAIDADMKRMEHIMLRLRTREGVDLNAYATLFGNTKELLKNTAQYIKSGHLKKSGRRIFATEKGFLILDGITRRLI